MKQAVREAVLDHKRVGNPVEVMKDGKVIIQPEDIVVPDEPVFLEEWGEDLTLRFKKTTSI